MGKFVLVLAIQVKLYDVYLVFCICSILNKLTPDNFDRLSQELLHLASSSNDRDKLKGAILLVSVPNFV